VADIIVAFDVPSARDALTLADQLPGLRWAKLGSALYVREGPALVRAFRDRGVQVFLDLKWHDIPSTVAQAVAAARDLGVSLATVHCLGGARMLEAAVHAAGSLPLVGVTVLTSHDAQSLSAVLGRSVTDVGTDVLRLAHLALAAGLRGVVASGAELEQLRRSLGAEPWIVVPGIREPEDSAADQVRTVTAREAVRRGATYVVVGRPVTRAKEPARALEALVATL
jgi:orotidine-5'-phosphate decarboxylase